MVHDHLSSSQSGVCEGVTWEALCEGVTWEAVCEGMICEGVTWEEVCEVCGTKDDNKDDKM